MTFTINIKQMTNINQRREAFLKRNGYGKKNTSDNNYGSVAFNLNTAMQGAYAASVFTHAGAMFDQSSAIREQTAAFTEEADLGQEIAGLAVANNVDQGEFQFDEMMTGGDAEMEIDATGVIDEIDGECGLFGCLLALLEE